MKASLTVLCLQIMTSFSFGALIGADNANNSAYNDGWQSGDNGGGIGSWALDGFASDGGFYGAFIGSSANLGGGGNIDVNGKSFGLYANDGDGVRNVFAGATRTFSGGPLSSGQQFSFVVSVNFRNGNKGFDLRDLNGNSLWNFNVGGNNYTINGTSVFGNAYDANSIFSFTFAQNANTLSYSVVRSGGLSGTESGTANISAGSLYGLRFYVSNTDAGNDANNLYINSFEVVPEPTNVALALFGAIGGAAFIKRRFFPGSGPK